MIKKDIFHLAWDNLGGRKDTGPDFTRIPPCCRATEYDRLKKTVQDRTGRQGFRRSLAGLVRDQRDKLWRLVPQAGQVSDKKKETEMEERTVNGRPHAGNSHVRRETGEAGSAVVPRRQASFCARMRRWLALLVGVWCGSLLASVSLSPSSQTVGASGGSYSFDITYTGGTSYRTPSASASWIHVGGIRSHMSTGGGTITQSYSVDANT